MISYTIHRWPCKREGRRFIGQYVQTQNDILPDTKQTNFEPLLYWDRVAFGGWNFDLHNPKVELTLLHIHPIF